MGVAGNLSSLLVTDIIIIIYYSGRPSQIKPYLLYAMTEKKYIIEIMKNRRNTLYLHYCFYIALGLTKITA